MSHAYPQNAFGNTTVGFSLFSSAGYGASDLLFSDVTHHLQRVLGRYTSWLGPSYTTMLQAFECEGKILYAFTLDLLMATRVHCSCSHYCVLLMTGFC